MATTKGKEGSVKVSDTLVAEVRSFEMTITSNEVDTSTMGSDWTGTDSTQKSWKGTLEAFWDDTDAGQNAIQAGEKVAIEVFPAGETTGRRSDSGMALVTSISRPQAHDGIISVTFEFTGDGPLNQTSVV